MHNFGTYEYSLTQSAISAAKGIRLSTLFTRTGIILVHSLNALNEVLGTLILHIFGYYIVIAMSRINCNDTDSLCESVWLIRSIIIFRDQKFLVLLFRSTSYFLRLRFCIIYLFLSRTGRPFVKPTLAMLRSNIRATRKRKMLFSVYAYCTTIALHV